METKNTYFKEEELPVKEFEKIGLSLDYLKTKPNILKDLMNGNKTQLLTINFKDGNMFFSSQAKLRLSKKNNEVILNIHGVRKMPELRDKVFDYTLTQDDKENLLKYGSNFKMVDSGSHKIILGIDPDTKELSYVAEKFLDKAIPTELGGVKLSEGEQKTLKEGGVVKVHNISSNGGEPFDANVYFNAGKQGLSFSSYDIQIKKSIELNNEQEKPKKKVERKI